MIFVSGLILLIASVDAINEHFAFDDAFYNRITQKYGDRARKPVTDWQQLIQQNQSIEEIDKLRKVNSFANRRVRYADDIRHWGQKDYWATPLESLITKRGDCEDYAILKYASLRAMGVSEDKLRLMYVRALNINQPHMVLIYFDQPGTYPLVLDNQTNKILRADKRTDLKPVYSFNGQGLWLARAKGLGKKVNRSKGVAGWTELLKRIEQGE